MFLAGIRRKKVIPDLLRREGLVPPLLPRRPPPPITNRRRRRTKKVSCGEFLVSLEARKTPISQNQTHKISNIDAASFGGVRYEMETSLQDFPGPFSICCNIPLGRATVRAGPAVENCAIAGDQRRPCPAQRERNAGGASQSANGGKALRCGHSDVSRFIEGRSEECRFHEHDRDRVLGPVQLLPGQEVLCSRVQSGQEVFERRE